MGGDEFEALINGIHNFVMYSDGITEEVEEILVNIDNGEYY